MGFTMSLLLVIHVAFFTCKFLFHQIWCNFSLFIFFNFFFPCPIVFLFPFWYLIYRYVELFDVMQQVSEVLSIF